MLPVQELVLLRIVEIGDQFLDLGILTVEGLRDFPIEVKYRIGMIGQEGGEERVVWEGGRRFMAGVCSDGLGTLAKIL